jgi:hypothetical protein
MSSTDLNNEDSFSDHPRRLPSFHDLFRAEAHISPDHFFRDLERQERDIRSWKEEYRRAVFLFRRMQDARRCISRLILCLIAVSTIPFLCLLLPEEWRLLVFTGGLVTELVLAIDAFRAHHQWQSRRRDYYQWLRLLQRRVNEL